MNNGRVMASTLACALACTSAAQAATTYRDPLDRAVSHGDDAETNKGDFFDYFVGDTYTYDDNLFRLPSDVSSLTKVVGPNASRSDSVNTVSTGLDAQWRAANRQSVTLNLKVDDNLYAKNSNLNNVSTFDQLIWNWGLGGVLTGELGGAYNRFLTSFVNTDVYTRNLVSQDELYASTRYLLGPHWAVFGGLMDSKYSLTAPRSVTNNTHQKTVDLGLEYATSAQDSLAFDYRYTDARFPNSIVLNAITFDPDYRDDNARLLARYVVSDKTTIDANAGYLKRTYPNTTIGSFSGEVGRVSLHWLATSKTKIDVDAWRELQADLTEQSDYYVSDGFSIAPVWTASEKINLLFVISRDQRRYLGSNPGAPVDLSRRDTVVGEGVTVNYSPTNWVKLNASVNHERRSSDIGEFEFSDNKGTVGITLVF